MEKLADCTPGSDCTRCSICCWSWTRCGIEGKVGRIFVEREDKDALRVEAEIDAGEIDAGCAERAAAAASSRMESAIWPTMSERESVLASEAEELPRPSLRAGVSSRRVARKAGAMPKSSAVRTVTARVKPRTR